MLCGMCLLTQRKHKSIVIFSKYRYKENHNFIYKDITIKMQYLGVIFNFNNSFVKPENISMVCSFEKKQLNLPLDIQLDLFHYLFSAIPTYGCEV